MGSLNGNMITITITAALEVTEVGTYLCHSTQHEFMIAFNTLLWFGVRHS